MKRTTIAGRLVCLILAAVMCLGLAACGGGQGNSGQNGGQNGNNDPEQTPEYVYTADYKELFSGRESYMNICRYTEDGMYATSNEKIGENIPEGVTPQYEGQYDVYASFLYFIDNSGKATKLEGYRSMEPEEDDQGRKQFSSSSYMNSIQFTDSGFVTVETVYNSWYDGEDDVALYSDEYWQNQKYEQKYYIRTFDKDGNELSCALIPTKPEEYISAYNMKLDEQGNIVFPDNNTGGVRAIKADGTDAYRISGNSGDYIDILLAMPGGGIGAVTYTSDGRQMLYRVNTENSTLDEVGELSFDMYNAVPGNGDYDFYCTNGTNFYGYNIGSEKPEKIFNWLSCDVNGSNVNVLNVAEDGTVTGCVTDWSSKDRSYSISLVTVSKVPYDSVPHKEAITMAAIGINYDVADMIVKFNRSNDQYRIEVSDYSEYNNDQDGWDAAQTKLNTEILSGNIPDIFCLSGLNYRQLAAKGILEDLYPFIDSDSELSRDDFFPNVLEAFSENGKLCTTVSGIYVSSVIGAASVVGDTPGWTYEEFNQALATMPEGCTAFDQYVTKSDILNTCLALDMDSFVDWSSGKCSFDSQQFIDLLNFANSFPSSFDWENYEWSDSDNVSNRLAQGRQMLVQTSAYSIEDIFYNNYTQFLGGKITYIGYPTSSGTGNMLSQDGSGYAMSSKCEHKDAVWQLLRQFFTKEYNENLYSLSSRVDVFDEKAKGATTVEYQKDDKGNYMLDENGEKIPVVRYTMWNEQTGENEEIYALEPEQVQQIRDLITSTTKVADYNNSIIEIVSEQAQAFFEGQKTAEDVARLIQSKANIYVNEQR